MAIGDYKLRHGEYRPESVQYHFYDAMSNGSAVMKDHKVDTQLA